jgi:hypothetical protein
MLLVSLFIASALAVDLDTRLTTPDGQVRSMTFHEVERLPPAPFVVELDGQPVQVALSLRAQGEAWQVEAVLTGEDRRGRPVVLSAPRITVAPEQEGRVRQGSRRPIQGTDPVQYQEESWELVLVVRPG